MENKQGLLYLVPKATFYNTQSEVVKKGEALHSELLEADRLLYTYLLYFSKSTYYSKSLIISNLLTNSLNKEDNKSYLEKDAALLSVEDFLIHKALFSENITHALKLLLSLKEKRINNARTTATILAFLFKRGNLDQIAIKYKVKVRELLIHALGLKTVKGIVRRDKAEMAKFKRFVDVYGNPFALEVIDFVNGVQSDSFTSPFLKEYVRVAQLMADSTVWDIAQQLKGTTLPIEVLEGFNSHYQRNISLKNLLDNAVVSEKQKAQIQNRVERENKVISEPTEKIVVEVDYSKQDLMALYRLIYAQVDTISENEIARIFRAINEKVSAIATGSIGETNLVDGETALITDFSGSTEGSKATHLHPFFKTTVLRNVILAAGGPDVQEYQVGGDMVGNLRYPSGNSNLMDSLLSAAEDGFKKVIVISDGFENVGSFDQVHKKLAELGHPMEVIHFNPVFSPKNFSFKSIGENVTTVPFSEVEEIASLVDFIMLANDETRFKQVIRAKIDSEMAVLTEGGTK